MVKRKKKQQPKVSVLLKILLVATLVWFGIAVVGLIGNRAKPIKTPAAPSHVSGVATTSTVKAPTRPVAATSTDFQTKTPSPAAKAPAEPVVSSTPMQLLDVVISPDEIIALANAERVRSGLPELTPNACLSRAARARADEMVALNYFSHTSPTGKHSNTFIAASGYRYRFAGENLARGFSSADQTFAGWLASPTHKANILDPDFQDIGVATRGDLVVQFFGSTNSPCN